MRSSLSVLPLLCNLAGAVPTASIERRQAISLDIGGRVKNELEQGSCRKVTFVFARASTEPGNMGTSMGPAVCTGLKKKYGEQEVACQGVGGPYGAALLDNVSAAGTTKAAINEMIRLLNLAATKCPDTTVVAGGYSQGSALAMNAVSTVPKDTKDRIVGVVLFGYTKNKQQSGGIPDYPSDQVKVFCAPSDGVCGGTLTVTAGHFAYLFNGAGTEATTFLGQKIDTYLDSWEYVEEEPVPPPKKTSTPQPKTTAAKPQPTETKPAPSSAETAPLDEVPVEEPAPAPKTSPKASPRPKSSSPSKPKGTPKSSPPPSTDGMSGTSGMEGMPVEPATTPAPRPKTTKPKSSKPKADMPPQATGEEESPMEEAPEPAPKKSKPNVPGQLNELGATAIIENGSFGGGLLGGLGLKGRRL